MLGIAVRMVGIRPFWMQLHRWMDQGSAARGEVLDSLAGARVCAVGAGDFWRGNQ